MTAPIRFAPSQSANVMHTREEEFGMWISVNALITAEHYKICNSKIASADNNLPSLFSQVAADAIGVLK